MSGVQGNEKPVMLLESASLAAHNLRDADSDPSADAQTTVHRGMIVQTLEGLAAGHVAAVVLDPEQQEVTHVLLVRERQQLAYCLIPVELIEQVREERVLLCILQPLVDTLPTWHSSE